MSFKIIHLVLGKANPNRMNGVNKVAHNHAMHLHELGFDVEIWGITKTPDDAAIDRPFPTRLFKQQPFYRDVDPKMMFALSKLPKKTVFHIHGAFIADFYKVSRMLMEMKIPYVYTPHGAFNAIALEKNKWVKKLYIQRYEKTMLKDAKKVHFLGQSEFDHISKIIKLTNKTIIPNGQDFNDLEFEFHKMNRKHSPVFGFCGRLDLYYKGLDLMLDGFANYIHKGGAGELWLIGDGPDRPTLEKKVRDHKIEDRVQFMGTRYGKEKLNRISNMDVFCHPSRSEGSPTAVLEAAALERPLIVSTATNVGQIVEVRGCGLHLKQTSPKTIEKALNDFSDLYNQDKHLQMGKCAYKMVKEEFNWNSVAKKLVNIYEESTNIKR
jgi:glycosyltransferase involved in cell wall biosynthesis